MPATFIDIIDTLGGGRPDGNGYVCLCPAHPDTNPSLRVTLKDDGRVLMNCRSHGCSFHDVVNAMGMEPGDFANVAPGGDVVTSSESGAKAPPTADQIGWLTNFINEAASRFADSPAAPYALERWGITVDQAARLRLGFTDRSITGEWVPYPWVTAERVVVPLFGFDGVPRGVQGRALTEDRTRWCSLASPPDNAWAQLGVLAHDHGETYHQLGEGPGDALTAWGTGTPAVFVRGTAMAAGVANTVVAGCRDKVVILAGDADTAGQNFNVVMGTALADAGLDVRVLALPTDVGDVTAWREADPDAFPRLYAVGLRSAEPFDPSPPPPPRPTPAPGTSFLRTVDGNAGRLLRKTAGNFVHCPAIGPMVFEDGKWSHDELNRRYHWMSELTFEMLDEGDALINEGTLTANPLMVESGDRLKSWAVRSQNSIFDDSIKRAERQSAVPVEQFDLGKHLLNCKNGTVDLRTSTLRPHDRGDFITHRLDYAFDPEATAPRWMAFLDEVFPGQPETVEWLQRVAGYAATGEVIEHCLVLCVGKGRNGKSVFWNAIANVLGSLVGHVGFATFEKKGPGSSTADLASLRGKRLAIVQEGEASTTLAESTIKRSTGGDEIACRNLYRSQMSFLPEFLISMSTNSAPRIRGADEGIWSRIRKVDFCRYFTEDERDPWLNQTLAGEAEGILRWIVDGAALWYEQGLSDPTAIKAATLDYRSTSDELAGFVGAVVVADADGSILGSDVMALYLDHCVEENVKPWSRRALYDALVERVETVKKVKRSDGIHLLGIRLASKNDGVG